MHIPKYFNSFTYHTGVGGRGGGLEYQFVTLVRALIAYSRVQSYTHQPNKVPESIGITK